MSSSDGALRRRASTKRRFAVAFPAGREKGKDACGTRSSSLFSPPSPFVSLFCAFFSGASLPPPVYLFAARVHKFCQRRGWREGEENRKKSAGVLGVSKIPQSLACGESGPPPSLSFSFPFSWSGGGGSECNFSAPSASFLFILQLCAAAERVFSLSFVCRCYSLRFFASPLRFFRPTGDARLLATTRTPIPLGVAGLFAVVAERWRCPPVCGWDAALVVVVFRRLVAVFVSCLGRLRNEMERR